MASTSSPHKASGRPLHASAGSSSSTPAPADLTVTSAMPAPAVVTGQPVALAAVGGAVPVVQALPAGTVAVPGSCAQHGGTGSHGEIPMATPLTATPVSPEAVTLEGQPVQAIPVSAEPVHGMRRMQHVFVHETMALSLDGRPAPPGAPGGGQYRTIMVIGPATFLISLLILLLFWPLFWLPFVCPCDEHVVYEAPNRRLYAANGRLM